MVRICNFAGRNWRLTENCVSLKCQKGLEPPSPKSTQFLHFFHINPDSCPPTPPLRTCPLLKYTSHAACFTTYLYFQELLQPSSVWDKCRQILKEPKWSLARTGEGRRVSGSQEADLEGLLHGLTRVRFPSAVTRPFQDFTLGISPHGGPVPVATHPRQSVMGRSWPWALPSQSVTWETFPSELYWKRKKSMSEHV